MRLRLRLIAKFLFLSLLVAPAWAGNLRMPAPPGTPVLDEPGVLQPGTVQNLESLLVQHEKATGEQIVVAIFQTLRGEDLVGWTNKVFQTWGIGKKGKDNGVLLALYWNDRRARIEVGYGLEPLLTDAVSKRILSEMVVPELKRGNPDLAMISAVTEILQVIHSPIVGGGESEPVSAAPAPQKAQRPMVWVAVGLLVLFLLRRIFFPPDRHFSHSTRPSGRPSRVWRPDWVDVLFCLIELFTGGRGGGGGGSWGGGGGGGSWTGGGGSSGGGGASDRW